MTTTQKGHAMTTNSTHMTIRPDGRRRYFRSLDQAERWMAKQDVATRIEERISAATGRPSPYGGCWRPVPEPGPEVEEPVTATQAENRREQTALYRDTMAAEAGSVAEAARNTRARMEIEHGPVGDDDVVEVHHPMTMDALEEALEAVEPGNWGDLTPLDILVAVHAIAAERDEARMQAGHLSVELSEAEAHVAEGATLEAQAAELLTQVSAERDRAWRAAHDLEAEARRYLDRLELVTLERDQLREAAVATEHVVEIRGRQLEETGARLVEAERDRDTYLELWQQSKGECGRLVDLLEGIESGITTRQPNRSEVADYADERDRVIAANADDRMTDEGPNWVPVLSGSIPTGGGMGQAQIHDPDDPVARAFFLDDPSGQSAHNREVAEHAESEVAERSWEHETIDEAPPDEG